MIKIKIIGLAIFIVFSPFIVYGNYDCDNLCRENAQELLKKGHYYLDGDNDGEACERSVSCKSSTKSTFSQEEKDDIDADVKRAEIKYKQDEENAKGMDEIMNCYREDEFGDSYNYCERQKESRSSVDPLMISVFLFAIGFFLSMYYDDRKYNERIMFLKESIEKYHKNNKK